LHYVALYVTHFNLLWKDVLIINDRIVFTVHCCNLKISRNR